MNTSENSGIKRLTDDGFNQISRILAWELAVLKAIQQVETNGRGGFFAPDMPIFLKVISSGVS
mgnify:FL=1